MPQEILVTHHPVQRYTSNADLKTLADEWEKESEFLLGGTPMVSDRVAGNIYHECSVALKQLIRAEIKK